MSRNGFSLIEVLVAVAVAGVAALVVVSRVSLVGLGLAQAARLAESQLVQARLHAIATRTPTEVTLTGTRLEVARRGGMPLSRVDLATHGLGRPDSIRLRPATIRFNARGHGSPGSIFLYRGRRGVRLVSNFVGRVRAVPFNH